MLREWRHAQTTSFLRQGLTGE